MDCDNSQYVKGCIRSIINQDFQEDPESSKIIRPGALCFFLRAPVSTVLINPGPPILNSPPNKHVGELLILGAIEIKIN